MTEDVGQLIADYERTVRKLNRLMECENFIDSDLGDLDGAVSQAFDALVDQDLCTQGALLEHLDYLLKLIKASYPNDTILQRLVDRVLA